MKKPVGHPPNPPDYKTLQIRCVPIGVYKELQGYCREKINEFKSMTIKIRNIDAAINSEVIAKWLNKDVELTNTTHFLGTKGKIISIDLSSEERAIYGYELKIKLTCGLTVLAYKFEGLTILTQ